MFHWSSAFGTMVVMPSALKTPATIRFRWWSASWLYVLTFLLLVSCQDSDSPYRTIVDEDWRSTIQLPVDTGGEHVSYPGKDFPGAPNGFYLYAPGDSESTDQRYPLLIFFHGLNELGNSTRDVANLATVLEYGVPMLIDTGVWDPPVPFFVLSPQGHPDYGWLGVDEMIDSLVSHYPIDPSRIYVTGISFGASAAWDMLGMVGENATVAAVVPIAGYLPDDNFERYTDDRGRGFGHVPTWAFHGGLDTTVPAGGSIRLVEATQHRRAEFPAQLTLFSEKDHFCWDAVYESDFGVQTDSRWEPFDTSIYDWMLQYRRVSQVE